MSGSRCQTEPTSPHSRHEHAQGHSPLTGSFGMSFHWHPGEQVRTGATSSSGRFLAAFVGILSGSASAFFLVSLEYATNTRVQHPWLLYGLPLAGLLIGLFYHRWGKSSTRGNNLSSKRSTSRRAACRPRMAPGHPAVDGGHASVRRLGGPRRYGRADGRQPRELGGPQAGSG